MDEFLATAAFAFALLFFTFLVLFNVTRSDINIMKDKICQITCATPIEYIHCKDSDYQNALGKVEELRLNYDKLVKEVNTTNK